MKVGIVGMGSIGRRHARCLRAHPGIQVVALRSLRGALKELPDDLRDIDVVHDYPTLRARGVDAVVVATPTSLHGAALGELAGFDVPLLIEKPLVGGTSEVPTLSPGARDRVVVAFCLRFHPLVEAIVAALASGAIGRVLAVRATFSSWLPGWHPYVDYRTEYMSRRDLGGGVLRTASHELDLVQLWAGPITHAGGVVAAISSLGIDADDVAHVTLRTASGASAIVELDYFGPTYVREGTITGDGGRIRYDLATNTAQVERLDGVEPLRPAEVGVSADAAFERMYARQAEDFLTFARTGVTANCRFDAALALTRTIEAAERAAPRSVGPANGAGAL